MIFIGALGGLFFALVAKSRGIQLLSPILLSPPVALRNLSELVGTLGFVSALTLIPLSTASAIAQAMPLFITLGAALIYHEPVGWRRWTAITIGFVGVLVIIRPGLTGFDPNALWAVLAVVGLGTRDLAARAVPRTVSNLQLATYGFLLIVPVGVIMLSFSGGATMPDGAAWGYLVAATLFGVIGYYAITGAARIGEVSTVTPFRYTRLLFALLIGTTLFGERPDALTYLGAALIVGSGLYTVLRERALKRVRPSAPPLV